MTSTMTDEKLVLPFDNNADSRTLRSGYSSFPSGVVAVCAKVNGETRGLAVSSFTTVSLDPPLLSFCIDRNSSTWPALRNSQRLGLSIFSEEQRDACSQLASKKCDRFANLELIEGEEGAIFLDGSVGMFECSIYAEVAAGDHDIVVVNVERFKFDLEKNPLVFYSSAFKTLVA